MLVSVTTAVEDGQGEIIGVAGVDLYCGTLDAYIRRIVDDLNEGTSTKDDDKIVAFLLLSPDAHGDRPDRSRHAG